MKKVYLIYERLLATQRPPLHFILIRTLCSIGLLCRWIHLWGPRSQLQTSYRHVKLCSLLSRLRWSFTFLCRIVRKIPFFCYRVGRGMFIFRSNLPALRIASSTRSIRLVAPTTTTFSMGENPSISLRNWLMVVVVSWESLKWFIRLPKESN